MVHGLQFYEGMCGYHFWIIYNVLDDLCVLNSINNPERRYSRHILLMRTPRLSEAKKLAQSHTRKLLDQTLYRE